MQEIEFAVPIPSRVSPGLDRARERHLRWVTDAGLVGGGEARRRYEFSQVADIAAHGFPDATGEDLDLCCDLLGWMFLFDDQFDAGDERKADALAVCGQLTDVLRGGPPAPGAPPIVTAFARCWVRMGTGMSPAWLRRTVHDWVDYLAGWPTKIADRAHGVVLDPAAHLRARRRTIGCRPVLALAERVGRFEVPPPVWHASHLEAMRLAACDAVIAMNEIHSYEKDRAGGYANLVSALVHHDGLAESQAVQRVRETVRDSVESFLRLRSGLPDFGRAVGAEPAVLARYGGALAAYIRGYHDWGRGALRYTTRGHPGDLGLENLLMPRAD
ncbi:terpene synthase family protein [Streptomyces yaizuensis]|uniref:R-linalool synthase n=1 Tax=Streptomyces yaizuensis TaxID=2989713 RepID=A0ABQ5P8A0_9ACTN|nr:pentalenene synthase [Streptomyces sp. YSPA8]GLF98821.1 R-linalool synthase [Streptomyces sp. YSPA8]